MSGLGKVGEGIKPDGFVLCGAPGAGKRNQADRLVRDLSAHHIEMSRLLPRCDKMKSGQLIDDEIVVQKIKSRMAEFSHGLCILDGYPRTIAQADHLPDLLRRYLVIFLEVPDSVMLERACDRKTCLTCGATYTGKDERCLECGVLLERRPDDNPETVKKRITVFHTQTKPILEHPAVVPYLRVVNANQSIDLVYSEIRSALQKGGFIN